MGMPNFVGVVILLVASIAVALLLAVFPILALVRGETTSFAIEGRHGESVTHSALPFLIGCGAVAALAGFVLWIAWRIYRS
jgi:hypothetical protein